MPDSPAEPPATPPTSVPPLVAIAWGRTPASRRGPRAGLDVEAIVGAAIEIADADGLEAVSMAKVAERLGYTPMSLYRHVPSKNDLLALVQDAAFGDPPVDAPTGDWRAGLGTWGRDVVAAYRAHLWALDIPISGPPTMPRQVAWLERALTLLRPTDLPPAEKLSVVLLVAGYARQWAQLMRDLERGYERAGTSPGDDGGGYARALADLIDADRFPAVHEAVVEGFFADDEDGVDEFEFGLGRILDGVEAHIRRRRG